MFVSLIKEINRLLSKGMLNIYFDFLSLKSLSPGQFWEAPTQPGITEFQNFFLQLKNQRSGSKTLCGFSIILIFEGIMTF